MTVPVNTATGHVLDLKNENTDGARGRQTRGTEREETGTATATATAIATVTGADIGMRTDMARGEIETTATSTVFDGVGEAPTTDPRDRRLAGMDRRSGQRPTMHKAWSNAPAHCLLKEILLLSARAKNPRSQRRSPTSAPPAR